MQFNTFLVEQNVNLDSFEFCVDWISVRTRISIEWLTTTTFSLLDLWEHYCGDCTTVQLYNTNYRLFKLNYEFVNKCTVSGVTVIVVRRGAASRGCLLFALVSGFLASVFVACFWPNCRHNAFDFCHFVWHRFSSRIHRFSPGSLISAWCLFKKCTCNNYSFTRVLPFQL